MILASGTGARDYSLEGEAEPDDRELQRARELLRTRGATSAVALLNAAPFQIFEATNHFNDEFRVLHAELNLTDYDRIAQDQSMRSAARLIRETFAELGTDIRLIIVDPASGRASWSPSGYECEPNHFAEGGYAQIFHATRASSGERVALKRLIRGDTSEEARGRLRREIQEQRQLEHPNIMPILDADSAFTWFTMPLALGNLSDLLPQLTTEELIDMVTCVARGLEMAHGRGVIHRDVTPRNILRLSVADGSRWVIADWGLVRRPRGLTTTLRTERGQRFGTEGFVAPEVANDGHEADAQSDVYSLGRVLGFALTSEVPRPNLPQNVQGQWRQLVRSTTDANRENRIQSMTDLIALIGATANRPRLPAQSVADRMLDLEPLLSAGSAQAIDELMDLARANPDDDELWLDRIGDLPEICIAQLVARNASDVDLVLERLSYHLLRNWGRRNYDDANGPLQRLLWIAQAAERAESWLLLEDAALVLFRCDAHCKRFDQRTRTRGWLISLDEEAAQSVARALLSVPDAVRWYLAERWYPRGAANPIRLAMR